MQITISEELARVIVHVDDAYAKTMDGLDLDLSELMPRDLQDHRLWIEFVRLVAKPFGLSPYRFSDPPNP